MIFCINFKIIFVNALVILKIQILKFYIVNVGLEKAVYTEAYDSELIRLLCCAIIIATFNLWFNNTS